MTPRTYTTSVAPQSGSRGAAYAYHTGGKGITGSGKAGTTITPGFIYVGDVIGNTGATVGVAGKVTQGASIALSVVRRAALFSVAPSNPVGAGEEPGAEPAPPPVAGKAVIVWDMFEVTIGRPTSPIGPDSWTLNG